MARHNLPNNNYFRGQEMSIVVCDRGGKNDDAKWLMETSSKVALISMYK